VLEHIAYGNWLPPANNNAAAHRIWRGAPVRTVAALLEHITYGDGPPLEFPTIPRNWTLQRMATSSSSSGFRASSAATPRIPQGGDDLYI
jgi:hypothetical protein